MSERVSLFEGTTPVLIIAPHGPDDTRTTYVAEGMISSLGCYGVINRGWRRARTYDYDKEHADCNNIEHIHKDVVKDEFLRPILVYHNRIRKKHPLLHVFTVHGIGKRARKLARDPMLDVIVGYGAGQPHAHTCELWRKNLFIHTLQKTAGLTVYDTEPRSPYAARNKNNLNQLFNMGYWYPDSGTVSMQIEVIHDLREDNNIAKLTGEFMGDSVKKLLTHSSWTPPLGWMTKKV